MTANADFPRPLVSAEWLADQLGRPDLRVLDASFFLPNQGRDAAAEFAAAHIPCSGFFDIDRIADRSNPLPHMLPSASEFAAAVAALGVGPDSRVVVYDRNTFMASARAWWMFRCFGHERVAVLDGGLARWQGEGRPLETGPPPAVSTQPYTACFHPELVRDLAAIRDLLRLRSAQLLDARSPGRFAGTEPEPRPGLRAGHIPGSHHLFYRDLVDSESHCLKPPTALADAFLSAGIDPERPVVTTCGTGVTAAILALGLYRLGNESVAVYDGSWTEWGGRSDTPVATGPAG